MGEGRTRGKRGGKRGGIAFLHLLLSTVLLLCLVMSPSQAEARGGRVQLIQNGDAEEGPGSDERADVDYIPGWTRVGMTVATYGGHYSSSPKQNERSRVGGKSKYFSCGWHKDSVMWQLIKLRGRAAKARSGDTWAILNGWIGGATGDTLYVQAAFLGPKMRHLGSMLLPPLTRREFEVAEGSSPVFFRRTATMVVPKGARFVNVTVTASDSGRFKFCEAFLDNLALYLEKGDENLLVE